MNKGAHFLTLYGYFACTSSVVQWSVRSHRCRRSIGISTAIGDYHVGFTNQVPINHGLGKVCCRGIASSTRVRALKSCCDDFAGHNLARFVHRICKDI